MEEQRLLEFVDQIFSGPPDEPQTTSQNLQALNKALQKASESTLQAVSDLLSDLEAQGKIPMDDADKFHNYLGVISEGNKPSIPVLTCLESPTQIEQGEEKENDPDRGVNENNKRTRGKTVGVIIEKLAQWRNLYNGVPNSNGEIVRLTLEEAATRVGISKKSLDGYLLLLKFGKKYGFNFEEHKNDKVGLLRAFVKKFKKIQSDLSKIMPGESIPSDLEQQISEKGTPLCQSNMCCVPPSGILKVPGQSSN